MKKKIIFVIIAAVVAGIGYFVYRYQQNLEIVSSSEEEIIFEVEAGQTTEEILENLYDDHLIQDVFFSKVYLQVNSIDSFQANSYVLSPSMGLEKIVEIISIGDFDYLVQDSMTIIEGTTVEDVAEVFASKLDMSVEDVLAVFSDKEYMTLLVEDYDILTEDILTEGIDYPLEGYLYPETYNLTNVEQSVDAYIRLILDFTTEMIEPYLDDIEETGMTIHEFLTFCSIVECESLYDSDKSSIAGVFYNRLNIGQALESDVTVLYALHEKRVAVTNDDLQVDSPYNTYLNTGLPIGPISNVTTATMEACLNPEEHDYYYFFALEDGTVIYSSTYEEHLQVVEENMWY